MTIADAQAALDTARARFGDACMADPPDRDAWETARAELTQAVRNLRGYPHTLYGTRPANEGAA